MNGRQTRWLTRVWRGVRWLCVFALVVLGVVGLHVIVGGAPELAFLVAGWLCVGLVVGYAESARGPRGAWLVLSALVGAALVLTISVAAGLGGLDYFARVSVFVLIAGALVGIVGAFPAVWIGQRVGRWTSTRRVSRWSARGVLAGGLLAAAGAVYSYAKGLGLVAPGDRIATFDRLIDTLDAQYSHWAYAPVTSGDLTARWRPRIVAASGRCTDDPCVPYLAAIRDMLSDLGDVHTSLDSAALPPIGWPSVTTDWIDESLAITVVEPGSDADRAGIRPGDVIRSIDGHPTAEALVGLPTWLVACSSPTTRRHMRAQQALAGLRDHPVSIELADGRTATLLRGRRESRPATSRFVRPAVLLLTIPSLTDPEVVGTFDLAIDQPGVRAVVIDLRGDGGGVSRLGDAIAGRFGDTERVYAHECFEKPHPLHAWYVGCAALSVAARQPTFRGPVAVLLDAGVVSSAEWLAAALCDTGRARCFGRATGGGSGNPVSFQLAGAVVMYSTGNTKRLDGSPIERDGVPPHVPITWHLSDVRAGSDPDLAAALSWVGTIVR